MLQVIDGDGTGCTDVFQQASPDGVQEGCCLFAVGLAHFGGDEWFYGRFVGTNLENFHFNTYFLQQILEENGLRCQTLPCDASLWVDDDLVGYTGQIIHSLGVVVSVCYNELAAILEVFQSMADFFQRSKRCFHHAGLQIDTLDILIFFSLLDRSQDFVQSIGLEFISNQCLERILLDTFG